MRSKIEIIDHDTNKVLENLGDITYNNTGTAIQDCERRYRAKLRAWKKWGYEPEIVLSSLSE